MAVRFAGTTDQLSYTGTLPDTTGGITVAFWVYLSVDRNDFSCMTRLSGAGTSILYLVTDGNGTTVAWFSVAGSIVTSFDLTVGAWHRIAATHAAGTGTIYTATATGATNVTTGTITTGTPGDLGIGGRGPGDNDEPFNGRIAGYKLYSAVLTQAEVEQEWQQLTPRRTANLHAWYPLLDATAGGRTDYSGNARTLGTGASAATTEDGPPVPWGPQRPQLIVPAPPATTAAGAGVATGAAAAANPSAAVTPSAGSGAGTCTGQSATAQVSGSADGAAGSGAAHDAAVEASGVTTAAAQAATASGSATAPQAAIAASAGAGSATATSLDAAGLVPVTTPAQAATATGTAQDARIQILPVVSATEAIGAALPAAAVAEVATIRGRMAGTARSGAAMTPAHRSATTMTGGTR